MENLASPDLDLYGVRRLCAAVIKAAYGEARGLSKDGHPVPALAWLASKSAIVFYEPLSFCQEEFLIGSEWRDLARAALARYEYGGPSHRKILRVTLDFLDSIDPPD